MKKIFIFIAVMLFAVPCIAADCLVSGQVINLDHPHWMIENASVCGYKTGEQGLFSCYAYDNDTIMATKECYDSGSAVVDCNYPASMVIQLRYRNTVSCVENCPPLLVWGISEGSTHYRNEVVGIGWQKPNNQCYVAHIDLLKSGSMYSKAWDNLANDGGEYLTLPSNVTGDNFFFRVTICDQIKETPKFSIR